MGIITPASKWVGTLGSFTDYVYKSRGVGSPKMSIFFVNLYKVENAKGGGYVVKKHQNLST